MYFAVLTRELLHLIDPSSDLLPSCLVDGICLTVGWLVVMLGVLVPVFGGLVYSFFLGHHKTSMLAPRGWYMLLLDWINC